MGIEVDAADGAVIQRAAVIACGVQPKQGAEQRAAEPSVRHHDDRILIFAMPGLQQTDGPKPVPKAAE